MGRWLNNKAWWSVGRWLRDGWSTWQSFFDNTKWTDDGFGVWNVNKWDAEDNAGDWTIEIVDILPWYIDFRPTSVRVTFTGQASIDFELFNDSDSQVSTTTITNLEKVPITFSSTGDFLYIFAVSAVGAFSITDIEFFG